MVLRSIKDRTRLKFNVAIAEVGDQNAWQQAIIGFAVVANEKGFVESMVGKITSFIESLAIAKIVDDDQDIIQYGEGEELLSGAAWNHWEPEEPVPGARGRKR